MGFRYAQALSKLDLKITLRVIDPLVFSPEKSGYLRDINGLMKPRLSVIFSECLPRENVSADLVIVSTTARGRLAVVNEAANYIDCDCWVLEKVLASKYDELEHLNIAAVKLPNVWVNLPRRILPIFAATKSAFGHQGGPFHCRKVGSLWGLASNAIHYLDIVSWMTGERLESMVVDSTSRVIRSKRRGYFEIAGRADARWSSGSYLVLEDDGNVKENFFEMKDSFGRSVRFYEEEGFAISEDFGRLDGGLILHSELFIECASSILTKGTCDLPRYHESMVEHEIMLRAFRDFFAINLCSGEVS